MTPKFYRRSSKPSTSPSSPNRSAHSDVSSDQHAEDKRAQDARKTASWLPMDDHSSLPAPDSSGPFWGDASGVSYRWLAGMPVEVSSGELFAEREKLRREFTRYKGRLMRKGKDGSVKESWVSRRLTTSSIETTNLTLPPWAQAAIRSKSREDQKKLMARITTRVCKLAGRTKREIIGVDWHCDTDKLHLELHTLRIDRKTLKILPMDCTTTWHLGQDRTFRAGLEDPASEEKEWREAAEAKRGLTIDLEMTRMIDEEVESWLHEHKLEKATETRKSQWKEIAKKSKEKRLLQRIKPLAASYVKLMGFSILTAYATRQIKELITQKERDEKIKDELKIAAAMDKVS